MFKKLKQKITEEQSPVRSTLSPQQQGQQRPSPTGNRSRTSSLTDQQEDSIGAPDKESFSRAADGINGNDSSSSQKMETQSFAQKLQLRVPSMESLFRSPVKETLFRSPSKESLVRSGSRESLYRIEPDSPGPVFDPPSDIESEAEESVTNLEGLNKEQLFHRLRRMEKSLGNYRGKYSELVTSYRTVQREKEKLQSILSQSQDKALRRIGELREELQMDQQAKKHLQEEFDASLEEKDQLISVFQTQIALLKQRLGKDQVDHETIISSEHENQNIGQEGDTDSSTADGSGDTTKTLDALQVRVKRQENLLQRCKERIRSYKEQGTQLSSEKDALQNQLDERLQELEKMKELHTGEKTKLINQLRDAKNLVEQLEQDKGMVIAETKRQMHEALMMKEEEVSQLRTRVKQLTTKCDQLQEQKEKSEKAAFEQLEKAVGASQSSEEAQKKGKQQMEEQIKAIEQASEEERLNLQKELSRVKQEVVDIMKKTHDIRILDIEKIHSETLQKKKQEYQESLEKLEEEYQERLKVESRKIEEDHLKNLQEKEQQALLALEEMELQKKAIQSQTENQLQEMQQELEECRTRILELESFLAKTSQDSDIKSEEMAVRIESETNKHNAEITDIIEKHKQELERIHQEHERNLKEQVDSLNLEHEVNVAAVKEKCDVQIQEKEQTFQSHIAEMNEKTLEKLDVKQTELEALSSELCEAQKLRLDIEEKLLACQNEMNRCKQEFEAKLKDIRNEHQEQVGAIHKEKELMTEGVEKGLKEEINHLKHLLDVKEKELERLQVEKQKLKEDLERTNADFKTVSVQLEELRFSYEKKTREDAESYASQFNVIQEKLAALNLEKTHFESLLEEKESSLKSLTDHLDSYTEQVQNLTLTIQEQNTKNNEYMHKVEELNRIASERENETQKLKETHNQQILELSQDVSSKEKRLEEYQAKLKSQDNKTEKMKQRIKEMQEASKKKYSEMESKMKKELERKQLELNNKEKQFNEKILEMAHASSAGISDAMSQLEQNHTEQMQSIKETYQRDKEETVQVWEKQVVDLKEKHELELQEKDQEVAEFKQILDSMRKEKEEADKQILELRKEKSKIETSFHEVQDSLNQVSAQVLTLIQSESIAKAQLEKVQNECTLLMDEKCVLEEKIHKLQTTVEEGTSKLIELVDNLRKAEEKCQLLETHNTDSAKIAKEMADKLLERESSYNELLLEQEMKLESCRNEVLLLLESMSLDLSNKYNDHMDRLILRILQCEKETLKKKKAILMHVDKIHNLEMKLEKISNEYTSVNTSLAQTTQLLQQKENLFLSMKDELNVLMKEKEHLQKEENNQQKVADEKESCITQLKKELSENINTVTSLSTALKDKDAEVNELKLKLENSVDLLEKEKTVALISSQHSEMQLKLQNQIQDLMSQIEVLNQEKAVSVQEGDTLKKRLEEWKKKAELKFTQNHQTVTELHEKIAMSKQQLLEKDEQIKKMTEDFRCHCASTLEDQAKRESKEQELIKQVESQNLRIKELENESEKLTVEKASLMEEIERLIQQQNKEKIELLGQLQHSQSNASESVNNFAEAQQKIHTLEKEIGNLKEEFVEKDIACGRLKTELTETNNKTLQELEGKLTAESAKKMAELKKKAEQKIASVKKQLMAQLDDKERSRQDLETQLQILKEHMQKEGQMLQEGLNQEKEGLEKKYFSLLEQHHNKESELCAKAEELTLKVQRIKELEDSVEIVEKKLCESEQIMREKELSLLNNSESEKLKIEQLSSKHMQELSFLQEKLAVKDSEIKALNEKMQENSKSYDELQMLFDEIQSQENTLKLKLQEAEGQIEKFRKEISKLQKDMRSLRKEHNHELDLLKKEIQEEADQKIKYEQEDMQLKHNSALKQLMREVNTQMAQKERELETAVQETIGKAQEVEAELLQSHHIEATQLHKKIAEKEDDLKRTVKKYEEILEAREEEMTSKVTDLQDQLEKLQEELSNIKENEAATDAEELNHGELLTQLALKTTQLNEAKLRDQELKEKMNLLEDQLKNYSRGVFVTPLGTPYKDVNHRYTDVSVFGEPTEFEYLRKVMFEYMMGRETKTMAKVITTVLRFPADQAQKILEKEDSKPVSWLRPSS